MTQDILRVGYCMYNYPIHNGYSIDISHEHHQHQHHHHCYLERLIYLEGSKREDYIMLREIEKGDIL